MGGLALKDGSLVDRLLELELALALRSGNLVDRLWELLLGNGSLVGRL